MLTYNSFSNTGGKSKFVYNESVIDVVIPFILIQISFIDIYYLQLIMKSWGELMNNEYYFMKHQVINKANSIIELKENSIKYFNYINERVKISRTRLQL